MTVAKSWDTKEWANKLPVPGKENVTSTMSTPAMRLASISATTTVTEAKALGTPWVANAFLKDMPLA
ncbi:hypothetical protein GCM10023183_09290 [Nibribacter koreensis]|uniref:Uncharacterized protein n=1 Tax=Nibribacter koreensis TaxID=1084519 RepID=A0ABP8FBD9_9BACT